MKKSHIILLTVLGILIVFGFILYGLFAGSYNNMVNKEEAVEAQWSQVENVYQRKFDLLPNLVSTAKNYAQFEQETLTEIIEARSKATQLNINADNLTQENLQQFQQNYQELNQATFGRLLATFERYPNLKASELYVRVQDEISGSENRITVERRKFNQEAQAYNSYIRRFPQNLLAGVYGFDRKAYFENEAAAEDGKVDVDALFNE